VKIRVKKVKNVKSKTLASLVREHIDIKASTVVTDEFTGYIKLSVFVPHQTVNHQEWYVDGGLHTNTVKSFWSLLKRGIVGQYHKVRVHHLPKYIDEFAYRHNNRKNQNIFNQTILKALGG